ncbi:T9SS sorting signal type C domain-containing protein [Flavobacterium sp.]|uniref:T9SS sorting signal type C domain-containing protein n=1 Tax=Flavobacterium sp. TaxID=239 RepID=UPI002B603714|nr:T9SS sorting signal type C domain-containing protein [Flavobacterium sp.]HSD07072.1 T9SS sorting signal type C domain-containing protein [Flavobacterium sp.]
MKTKLFFSLAIVLVHGFGFGQSTFTSIKNGNWNDPTTWSFTNSGVSDSDGIPDENDDVILTGDNSVTVDSPGTTLCNSLLFQNSTLNISEVTLWITGKIVVDASNSENITATIKGSGFLYCDSFDVGRPSDDPKNANYTTVVKSEISNLNINGNLTIYSSSYNNTYTNNATFSLQKGLTGINGQIKTINENKGTTSPNPLVESTATFTTATNLGPRLLNLSNPITFSLSETGISSLVLNGIDTTVNYINFGDQNIINSDYYNLILSSGGTKKFPDTPINISNTLNISKLKFVLADLGTNVTHTTKYLILGDIAQLTGTYGGSISTATNINDWFFYPNTGILKVIGTPCTGPTKTWDGVSWSGGTAPTSSDQIVFEGDYSSSGDLFGCNCTVNSGNVTINTDNTLTLVNEITVAGGSLTFENDSNLIQKNTAANTGNITYKRNSNGLYKNDSTVWSSPVSGLTSENLLPNTTEDDYLFYNRYGWFSNFNYSILAGDGFAVKAPKTFSDTTPTVFTAEFKGVPNNGDILVPSNEFPPSIGYPNWQLIGNPYPSALDLNKFFAENGFSSPIYFWVNSSKPNAAQYKYKSADYACFNATGGVSGDNGIVPDIKFIRAGQGFFIIEEAPRDIIFKNSMRVRSNNSQFFRLTQKADDQKSRLWLNLTNDEGLFKQILIGYITNPSPDINNSYDAFDFNNNKYADFYTKSAQDYRLVIQGILRPFAETDEIPLGFMVNLEKQPAVASQFTISISNTDGDLDQQPIYLYDKVNDSTNDLRKGGYTFSSVDGTFDDRFVIKFINNDLGVNDFDKTSKDLIVAVKNKIISVNAKAERIEKILVFDVSGKLIYSKNKIGNSTFDVSALKTKEQILLVKTQLENGNSTTKKIVFN